MSDKSSDEQRSMSSKYHERVEHAMKSWQRAMRSELASNDSVVSRRRALMEEVLAEQDAQQKNSDGKSFVHVRPNNYQDFLSRVRTYKASTWFAKPNQISAMHCSRYGWINDASNHLICPSCKNTLVHDLDDDSGEKLKGLLRTAHLPTCLWGTIGLCNPISFLYPPHTECMDSVLDSFCDRLRKNWNKLLSQPNAILTWSMVGSPLTLSCDNESKKKCNVTALLTCEFNNSKKNGFNSNDHSIAASLAEYVFDALALPSESYYSANNGGTIVTKTHRDLIMKYFRDSMPDIEMDAQVKHSLVAYSVLLHCTLTGLDVDLDVKGDSDTPETSLKMSCALCKITTRRCSSSTSSEPFSYVTCHRNYCPHVISHTLPQDNESNNHEENNTERHDLPTQVPAGWIVSVESLLTVSSGADTARNLLGSKNLYISSPDHSRVPHILPLDSKWRKRTMSSSNVSSSETETSSNHASENEKNNKKGNDSEAPHNVYKKIKLVLNM